MPASEAQRPEGHGQRRSSARGVKREPGLEDPQRRLVIGVDLGTTRDAVAVAVDLGVDTNPIVHGFAPDTYQDNNSFAPTHLYYEPGARLPLGSADVKRLLNRSTRKENFDPRRLLRSWKILFHDHQDNETIKYTQAKLREQLDDLQKTEFDILRDWVYMKYKDMFPRLRDSYPDFDDMKIEIVVAVPPARSMVVHEKVRQAFVQGPVQANAVSLTSEPAAMFCSWAGERERDDDTHWEIGQRYLVADGGGGTCCLVRYILDGLDPNISFRQESASEKIISETFIKLAKRKFPELIGHAWDLELMRRNFDDIKLQFDTSKNHNWRCSIEKPEAFGDGYWDFNYQEIAGCFNKCLNMIIAGIDRQVRIGQPVDFICIGGGLFENEYIREKIKSHFSPIRVFMPLPNKGHVAKGAVRDRCLGDFIKSCSWTRCKAICTWYKIDEEIKRLDFYSKLFKQTGDLDGKQYIFVAEIISRPGESVKDPPKYKALGESRQQARIRHLSEQVSDLNFKELIVTFEHNVHPKEEFFYHCNDDTWIDQYGDPVSQPVQSDVVTWDLSLSDIDLNTLDEESAENGKYKLLRYTPHVKVSETETKFTIQIWPSQLQIENGTSESERVPANPVIHDAYFTPHEISRTLAQSFKMEQNRNSEANDPEQHHRSTHTDDRQQKTFNNRTSKSRLASRICSKPLHTQNAGSSSSVPRLKKRKYSEDDSNDEDYVPDPRDKVDG